MYACPLATECFNMQFSKVTQSAACLKEKKKINNPLQGSAICYLNCIRNFHVIGHRYAALLHQSFPTGSVLNACCYLSGFS